ncbi:hypothetical protein TVAG_019310 [Trichomonas vaginalis G3]|uniref:Glycosyltransferase 61 catalytic domain-containing protein n=1 Tax=Trichomonas vaginalis (strain ATCC PRA-98 / G3) TaxID=412133 RepID=A2DX04_TRIV3|nr:glycosyltransferase family [Trichomonas vaginalis G3]EAY15031.1 hypothetical protein TVAG_019310 [Trichomonas vaginalis G3]KAI5549572.1 glycosyltransferase family [Trichomonas vaginalis G3]|eukprot:XP_001327254.1 hypothetical protein [Trichomonas vaginalis G3]
MEDIFVQRRMIVKNDTIVRTLCFGKAVAKNSIKPNTQAYEEMVYVYQFWNMFGHNIEDYVAALMFVPKELNDRGFFVLTPPCCTNITYQIARYLGINVTFVTIRDERREQIFAKKLWIITSRELGHGYASGGFHRMRAIIFQKEEYKKIKPERYVVVNRPPRSRRFFDDANKLVKILNENTTLEKGCQWVRDDKSYGIPFSDMIKYWMSLKVLVTVQGSGIYNGIFMHENTGMCLLFCDIVDTPNLQLCTHLHIFTIGVIHPGRPILSYKAQPTNYTDMVTYTQRVVDAVYNGHWTSLDGLRGFLNASYPVTNATYFLYNYKEYARHW